MGSRKYCRRTSRKTPGAKIAPIQGPGSEHSDLQRVDCLRCKGVKTLDVGLSVAPCTGYVFAPKVQRTLDLSS